MAIIVGSVAVEVVPSAKGFREKLAAAMKDVNVDVPVSPDTTGFREKVKDKTKGQPPVEVPVQPEVDEARLKKARQRIEDLGRVNAVARIGVDDKDALIKLDRTHLRLLELSKTISSPKIDITGITRAELELHVLERDLERVDRQRTTLNVDKSKVDAAAGGVNLLGLAIAALGPALIPAAAGLTAVVGGLAVPLAAATAGVGAFAVFAVPAFTAVTKASTALAKAQDAVDNALTSKARQTALIRQRQLMADLSPATLAAVKALDAFKAAYQKFATALGPQILGVFNQGLQVATAALPLLASLTRAVTPALTLLGRVVAQAFTSPAVKQFVAFLSAQAGPAITAFGFVLLNLAEGFGKLLVAFAPLGRTLLFGLVSLSQSFATLADSKGFKSFLSYIVAQVPLVLHFLGDLIHTAGILLAVLRPFGGLVFKGLDLLVVGIGKLAQSMPLLVPAVLAVVAAFMLFDPIKAAFAFLTSPIGLVVAGLALLAVGFVALYKHSKTFRDIIAEVGKVATDLARKALPVLKTIMHDVGQGIHTAFDLINGAITKNRPQIDSLIRGFKTFGGFLVRDVLPILGPALKYVFVDLGVQIALAVKVVSFLVSAFIHTKNAVRDVVGAFEAVISTVTRWGSIVGRDVAGAALAVGRFFTRMGHDVKAAFDAVLHFVTRFGGDLLKGLLAAVAFVSAPFRAAFGFMSKVVGAVLLLVHDIIAKGFQLLRGLFDRFVSGIQTVWHFIWDHIKGYVLPVFNFLKRGVTAAFDAIKAAFETAKRVLLAVWHAIFDPIQKVAKSAWKSVTDGVTSAFQWVSREFSTVKNFVVRIWNDLFKAVKDILVRDTNFVKTGVSRTFDAVKAAFHAGVSAIKTIWDGLKAIAEAPIKFIVNTVYNDGIRAVFAKIASAVGSKAALPGIKLGFAAGGVIPGPVSPVDNTLIMARTGEGILVPEAVRALGGERGITALNRTYGGHGPTTKAGLPAFAGGGVLSGIGHAIGGAASSVLDILTDPLAAFKHLISGLVSKMSFGSSAFGKIASGFGHKIVDMIGGAVGKFVGLGGGSGIGGPISGGGAHWASMVSQILTMMGQPLSLLAGVIRRINFESGGNPNAINLTDSNARAGHPSQGLMQTIPGTFAAYAGAYAGRGITDPFANIWAGLHYALSRYGSIAAIDPLVRPRGYAAGGVITEPIFGVGRSGQTYTFGESGHELVSPLSGRGHRAAPAGGIHVTINGALDPKAVGQQLEQVLMHWQRTGKGGAPLAFSTR